jgi:hypothetical protein
LPELAVAVAEPAAAPRLSVQQLDALLGLVADLIETRQWQRQRLDPEPTTAQRAEWTEAASKIAAELGPHPRSGCSPARWRQLLTDAQSFIADGWLHRAHSLGWTYADLLGCDRDAPWARVEHMGLVVLLDGNRVIWITAQAAYLKTNTGAAQRFRRVPPEERIDPKQIVLLDQIKVER